MSATEKRSVTITLDGTNKKSVIPLMSGTVGPDVFDIRKVYNELGLFTFDPGYGATASCDSKITYIDGDVGVLLYRGYPIEQLAEKSNFLEVCYLLLNGELPDPAQGRDFELGVMRHTILHEQLRTFHQRDQADTLGREQMLEATRHHATVPRSPVERHDARLRPFDRELPRQLVQHFVGDRIVRLADSTKAGRVRREQSQHAQVVR